VGDGDVETISAASGTEALEAFRRDRFDCVVLDPALPDMVPAELVRALRGDGARPVPVVLYGNDASETELALASEEVVMKRARSPEQLLDETNLFLHRVETRLPPQKREMLRRAHEPDPVLAAKTVLLVDDDVRNAFALTSALERHRMNVVYAESGVAALELARRRPDLVLMDVMMPGMDGLETIRRLRGIPDCAGVPIIAITAKAMKGDREACLQAGPRTTSRSRSTRTSCCRCCASGSTTRGATRHPRRRRGLDRRRDGW